MSAHRRIERSVLRVYRKVNPSFHKMNSRADVRKMALQRGYIFGELGLPEQAFAGKKLLDVGGGTGEKSLFYAQWGADVTLLDANEISCARARKLFARAGKRLKVIHRSFFDVPLSLIRQYDIVVCDGVLNHTYDPAHALRRLLSGLREGAIAIIGISEYYGWFKRLLQRKLVRDLAGKGEASITRVAKRYFHEHIGRAVKFGLRTERAVIYDTYVNPQDQPTKLKDICDAFHENKVRYLAAYPSLNPFYQTNPWSQWREDKFNYRYYRRYYAFLEKIWMTCGEEALGRFQLPDILRRVQHDSRALMQLKKKISSRSFTSRDLRSIQKGYSGVGMSYFVGVKQSR